MTFRELVEKYNLTLKGVTRRFGIPYRTVQDWNEGKSGAAQYIINMMDEILSHCTEEELAEIRRDRRFKNREG